MEVGLFFRNVWTALLTSIVDGNPTKNGFGSLSGEFWLGNDNIHRLTDSEDVILRVDLEDFEGNITYAEYTTFKVADEADKYRLLIGGYKGTAGDSMAEGLSLR